MSLQKLSNLNEEPILLKETCALLDKCKIINFPKITDYRGNLSFIEENHQIPFSI